MIPRVVQNDLSENNEINPDHRTKHDMGGDTAGRQPAHIVGGHFEQEGPARVTGLGLNLNALRNYRAIASSRSIQRGDGGDFE